MTRFSRPPDWESPSVDPNDETFGDVVEGCELAEADGYDALLVGEPFDDAVVGRRGASRGPEGIREALAGVKTHHLDAGPVGSVGDLGDVAFLAERLEGDLTVRESGRVESFQERLRDVADEVHTRYALPVFLGGDNSLTYANVAPLLEGRSVGVVNLDAHLDVREVRDDATSGTPYRQLLEAGLDGYACLGVRHFETSTAYHDYARERDCGVVTAEEVAEDPVDAADRALEAVADVDVLYVSLDCDVFEASAAPGVSAPTPGGPSTLEVFRVLRLLAGDDRVAGFEVVECAPPLDEGDRTVDAAARAVAHFLAGYGAGGGGGGGGRAVGEPGAGGPGADDETADGAGDGDASGGGGRRG